MLLSCSRIAHAVCATDATYSRAAAACCLSFQVDIPLLLADYKRVVKLTEKVKGFLTDQVRLKPQTLLSPALVYVLELSTHRDGNHSCDSAHYPSLNHTLTLSFPPSHSLTHSLASLLSGNAQGFAI
jgi:hypothetical protein